VEGTPPSNQMDLEQGIQVINPKDNNVSPEERHKCRTPKLQPVPKDLNHFQQATIEIYQYQYKNCFMAAKWQEWELLPILWLGTMSSYLKVKKFMGPEKTEELLKGWTPMSCNGPVQQIKAWLKNQSMLSEDQKRRWPKARKTAQWKILKPQKAKVHLNKCQKSPRKQQRPTRRASKRQRERQSGSGASLTRRITIFPRKRREPWKMC
ncbi:hypothetical protein O181_106931, partial [Austropuccinia psidii MF-1]|nr:hypothetical protein [Austropuccinia psidii MF-1]